MNDSELFEVINHSKKNADLQKSNVDINKSEKSSPFNNVIISIFISFISYINCDIYINCENIQAMARNNYFFNYSFMLFLDIFII